MIDPALAAFVFATTACPGPNAALMLAVGARGGVGTGMPILVGIALANVSIKIGTAAAAQGLIAVHGLPTEIVQWPAFVVCFWFFWRIVSQDALAASNDGRARGSAVVRLADGFAFQLTNPKAWITGWAAATLFAAPATGMPPNPLVFGVLALPGVLLGAGSFLILGARYAALLSGRRMLRALNLSVAGLMALAIAPLLIN